MSRCGWAWIDRWVDGYIDRWVCGLGKQMSGWYWDLWADGWIHIRMMDASPGSGGAHL